ncbi:MAG: GFA family protein [Devosia sp.]
MEGHCHCGRIAWTLDDAPESVTACNCTICRRYGVLWAYGFIGHDIHTHGVTTTYRRCDGGAIDFHFCGNCSCITHYIATKANGDGRYWTAVNLRLTEPDTIAHLPIDHFDGLDSFNDRPRDDRRVKDMWF